MNKSVSHCLLIHLPRDPNMLRSLSYYADRQKSFRGLTKFGICSNLRSVAAVAGLVGGEGFEPPASGG